MRRIIFALGFLLMVSFAYSQQRILTWSVGDVHLKCTDGGPTKLVYPIEVEINEVSGTPKLGDATVMFYFDSGNLSNMTTANVLPNYSVTVGGYSAELYGSVFNFTSGKGRWVTLNLVAPSPSGAAPLSAGKIKVFDVEFD